MLRTRIARWVAIVAAIAGLYALAGFVIAPRLARSALLEDIPRAMNVSPSVGGIHINPFLFQVDIRDFALAGRDGEKLLGFGRLFIDFQLSSIWHRAYTFKRIELASPYVNAVVARDGTLNLLALRPNPERGAPGPKTPDKPLPALRVGSFEVDQGSVSYQDQSHPSEFAALIAPINFELRDFVTGVAGGLFSFTGVSRLGERVEWHGHLSVQPIESDGELRIAGLHARTLWEYLEDRLNFVVDSGTIDLRSTYRFALRDAIDLQTNVSMLSLTDLQVKPKNSDVAWVSIPRLAVAGTSVDLSQRPVQVESVSVSGAKLLTWLEPDGSCNLVQLAALSAADAGAHAECHRRRRDGRDGRDGRRRRGALASGAQAVRATRCRDFRRGPRRAAGGEGGARAAVPADRRSEPRSRQAARLEPRQPHQRDRVALGQRSGDSATGGRIAENQALGHRSRDRATLYRAAHLLDLARRTAGRGRAASRLSSRGRASRGRRSEERSRPEASG
jgi:hypothetical protein